MGSADIGKDVGESRVEIEGSRLALEERLVGADRDGSERSWILPRAFCLGLSLGGLHNTIVPTSWYVCQEKN